MTEKTGRNDPCPCGSGKKFKHCCIEKDANVIPFTSGKKNDNAGKFKKNLTGRKGQKKDSSLSYMEKKGTPNAATDVINELKDKIKGMDFQSKEELENFINSQVGSIQNIPEDDFLGFSPAQMDRILHRDFSENTEFVKLNDNVSRDLFQNVSAIRQCMFLFKYIGETEKGIKSTLKGNFPRKLVQDFYDAFIRGKRTVKSTPMKEEEVFQIRRLRYFLSDTGLIKKQKGYFSLTKKGNEMFQESEYFELYKMLFVYIAETYNWLYGTRYNDIFGMIQRALIFCLFLLKKKAKNFINAEVLGEFFRTAYPPLEKSMPPEYGPILVKSGFSHLFLDRFAADMGLLEIKYSSRDTVTGEYSVRTTGLFRDILIWGELE